MRLRGAYPEAQIYGLAVDHHVGGVVVEDCWNIFSRKCICGVTDEKTGFTDSSGDDKDRKCVSAFAIEP